MALDASKKKVFEYVIETTFGTLPTNPVMKAIAGYCKPLNVSKEPKIEHFTYLKDAGGSNFAQATKSQKVAEAFEFEVEYKPTGWADLKYVLGGGTEVTPAIGDTIDPISIGTVVAAQYEHFNGGIFSEWECALEPEKAAVCKLKGLLAKTSAVGGTDYIGIGSHASAPSGAALQYDGITNVLIDAVAPSDPLPKISWGVKYPVKPVLDITKSWASKVAAWARGQRNIWLKAEMDLEDLDPSTTLLGGAAHTLAFTLGGKTFTFSNVIWKNKFSEKLDPDDTIAMPFEAEFANLVIT